MPSKLIQSIETWERANKCKLLVYCATEVGGKVLGPEDAEPMYEALRRMGSVKRLDLLLNSSGGSVTAAYKIALLVRQYAGELRILIPKQARSAATLMTLAADTIVMGPLGELSPIDPIVRSAAETPSGRPASISSEEIRLFDRMAAEWFGVPKHQQAEVFKLMCSHVFPTALTEFYRADKYAHYAATNLMKSRQGDRQLTAQNRRTIKKLIRGFDTHFHSINRTEANSIGLPTTKTTAREDDDLWQLWCLFREYARTYNTRTNEELIKAIIVTGNYASGYIIKSKASSDGPNSGNHASWKEIRPNEAEC